MFKISSQHSTLNHQVACVFVHELCIVGVGATQLITHSSLVAVSMASVEIHVTSNVLITV
jgi:pyrimidine deaminase RibD-like protein